VRDTSRLVAAARRIVVLSMTLLLLAPFGLVVPTLPEGA
jgi:hypothetical protein